MKLVTGFIDIKSSGFTISVWLILTQQSEYILFFYLSDSVQISAASYFNQRHAQKCTGVINP